MSPRAAWRLEAMGFSEVYEYAAGLADWAAAGLPVEGTAGAIPTIGTIAHKDVPRAQLSERVGDVAARATDSGWDTAVVVNEQGVVLGRLFKIQLESDAGLSVESVMKPGPATFRPNVSVPEMAEYMRQHELETAPVTTSEGVLVGMVLQDDVDQALNSLNTKHDHHS